MTGAGTELPLIKGVSASCAEPELLRFAVISLRASPINRVRVEAGRQVPGLSQPPDRPSRQPILPDARPSAPSPACHTPLQHGAVRSEPGERQGLGAAACTVAIHPVSTFRRSHLPLPGSPHSVVPRRNLKQRYLPNACETWVLALWGPEEMGKHRLRWRNLTSWLESNPIEFPGPANSTPAPPCLCQDTRRGF